MHIKPQDLVNSRELLNQLGHAHHDLVQEKTDMTNDVPTTLYQKDGRSAGDLYLAIDDVSFSYD